MNLPPQAHLLLSPDPIDAGCGEAFDLLDRYVELLMAGADPDAEMPRVGAHLRGCGPCHEVFEGVLFAVRAAGGLVGSP
jgi:hypothetical protein